MELCLNPELIKKWTKIKRREAKESKKADQPINPSEMLENKFLRNLIEEFLEVHLCNYSSYSVVARY
jgi:intron-binding protein aquarius